MAVLCQPTPEIAFSTDRILSVLHTYATLHAIMAYSHIIRLYSTVLYCIALHT